MIQAHVIDYFFFHLILHESFYRKHDARGSKVICKVRVSEWKWEGKEGRPRMRNKSRKRKQGNTQLYVVSDSYRKQDG